MGEVKGVVSKLVRMLEVKQKETEGLVDTMHQLHACLQEESNTIICGSLNRLLSTVRIEAAKITGGSVVVLISPQGRATVDKTYSDENSDSYLRRLKSQGFYILTLPGFSYFIQSLKSEVVEGNLVPIIEFLKENAKIEMPLVYPDVSSVAAGQPREAPTTPKWRLSDFLPAPFPHPPLPRRLFRH